MNDCARLNCVDRTHILAIGWRAQPRRNDPAPGQVDENDRDKDQGHHCDANERADEPGEEPPYEYAEKNPCQETEATPLETAALRSTHAIASIHRDPQNARVRTTEPRSRIDFPSEYRTSSRMTFIFRIYASSDCWGNQAYRRPLQIEVWTGFVLTAAPVRILVWRMFRRRIGEYQLGRRALPAATAPGH